MKKNIINFIVILLVTFIYAAILMWLWNIILVPVLNISIINYWQSFGIYIISNILFKSSKIKME